MHLDGPQLKKLREALLSAFSGDDLERLVRFELNVSLDNIVGGGPLSAVVFDLIRWAETHGRAEELIRAARQARPRNPQLRALAEELLPAADVPATGPGGATLDGPRRARLRAALLDQFPSRTDLAMLVDDVLGVRLDEVAGGATLTEVVFRLVEWAGVDPGQRLRPLLAEAARRRPNSRDLDALFRELFGR